MITIKVAVTPWKDLQKLIDEGINEIHKEFNLKSVSYFDNLIDKLYQTDSLFKKCIDGLKKKCDEKPDAEKKEKGIKIIIKDSKDDIQKNVDNKIVKEDNEQEDEYDNVVNLDHVI